MLLELSHDDGDDRGEDAALRHYLRYPHPHHVPGENAMIVDDALHRIDSVLNLNPLAGKQLQPEHPEGTLRCKLNHVHFSYDGKNEVIKDVPFHSRRTDGGLCGTFRRWQDHAYNLIYRFF